MDNNFVCLAHLRKAQRSWIKVVIKNGFVYQEVKNYKNIFWACIILRKKNELFHL